MQSNRLLTIIASFLALGLGLWAYFSLVQSPAEVAPTPGRSVSVRLAWLPGATFAGDYVAKQNGFWTDEDLNVDLRPGGFEFDAIKLVASGADDFGVTSGPQLLQARAKGVPVVAIAATIPDSPIGWVAHKTSGIATPQQFVGRRVGAEYGTHTEITFEALLRKLGIQIESVTRVPVKFDPAPFVSGAVDVLPVYIIDQPIDLEAKGIQLNIIDPRRYGVAFTYGNLYFTTERMVRDHPDIVRAFLLGAKRGWIEAFRDRENAVKAIVAAAPDLDSGILRQKLDRMFEFIGSDPGKYPGLFPITAVGMTNNIQLLVRDPDFPKGQTAEGSYTTAFMPN